MGFATRQDLENAVANQFVTSEIVPFVPTAIGFATSELNRRVRCREMIARSDATMNSQYTSLPSDYLDMKTLYLKTSPVERLEFISNEEMAAKKESGAYTGTSKPLYFTIEGSTLEVLPVPVTSYTVEMVYYSKIADLTTSASSNWLLTNYSDIYFYATLMHAAPYIRGDERVTLWASAYEKSLEQLRLSDERSTFSGGVLKVRTRSY